MENAETFLEYKSKKKWKDPRCGHKCFMLYPRSLYITWGNNPDHWTWNCFKETSSENIEVAKLLAVCWLDVRGKLDVTELTPGQLYEAVYQVKLARGSSGWELPITLRLTLPNGETRLRQVSLLEKPKGEWVELQVGSFTVDEGVRGEVCFDMLEHGGHWKNGLYIRGTVLRPMS